MAPRPFPFELVDHILAQDVLADADLAACCLVSRSFLPIARRQLYLVYSANILWIHEAVHSFEAWDPKSEAHFQCLKAHPHLACLVRRFTLGDLHNGHEGSAGFSQISATEIAEISLDFLQPLQALEFEDDAFSYLDLLVKHRASLRSLGRFAVDREGFDFLADCPKLTSLEVTSNGPFEPAQGSVVSIPASRAGYLRDLAPMISTAGRIQVLTLSQFHMSSPTWKENVLFSASTIAAALPLSLRRLNVQAFLSLRTLSYLTDPTCPARFRIIGARPYLGAHFAELYGLVQYCAEKGVELVRTREDLFEAGDNNGEALERLYEGFKVRQR
ncbi:hypothetical protein JCM10207_001291 [Rhodosporidiobolus poonsookiae]